jgi:hypothetical protein
MGPFDVPWPVRHSPTEYHSALLRLLLRSFALSVYHASSALTSPIAGGGKEINL